MNESEENLIPETAPFRPEEVAWLNRFLPALNAEQSAWLEGFLTGQRAGRAGEAVPRPSGSAPSTDVASAPLRILYGSESGNAEALAFATADRVKKEGYKPEVLSMGDIGPEGLKETENLLVIVSTWGEGDPPEPAEGFYEGFMNDRAPSLKGVRFSVCGLGDTAYEEFCKMGKDFDARIEALGGERVAPRADCDVDYEEPYAEWLKRALSGLKEAGALASAATANGNASAAAQRPATAPEPVTYARRNPLAAELTEKILLNGEGSQKETIHLEFDLGDSGLTYEPGDSLAVIPTNAPEVVDDLLKTTKLAGDESISLKEGSLPLRQALTEKLDITTLTLQLMKRYAELAKNADLDKLIDPDNKEKLQTYLYGREIIDLLHDFPARDMNADALASLMRKLPPRLYSIASSLKAHPGEVHLTVAVVRYDGHGRRRQGVCSTYLADRLATGERASIYPSRNKNFKLPEDPDTPIIMVGPGTGIAPFRAFVEERVAIGAQGRSWLFFGDQHYLYDFLYQLEWQDHLKKGNLSRLDVAFSRDQPEKIYVQDRMLENAKDLYAWLQEGAVFYVCGDATRMAVDVDKALHTIVEKEGDMSGDDAAAYVKQLKSEKRYLRDVY